MGHFVLISWMLSWETYPVYGSQPGSRETAVFSLIASPPNLHLCNAQVTESGWMAKIKDFHLAESQVSPYYHAWLTGGYTSQVESP